MTIARLGLKVKVKSQGYGSVGPMRELSSSSSVCGAVCRLDDEQKESQRCRDDAAELSCKLREAEHQLFELQKYIGCLKSKLALMEPKLEKYEREAELYSQQYVSHFTAQIFATVPVR